MGIYIDKMEMPMFCDDCWMCQNSGGANELGDDFCCIGGNSIDDRSIRPDWCPLVSIQPHGDLIDRDALPWEKQGLMLTDPDEWGIEARYIEAAPVIIPGDKEEKHENLGR